MKLPKKGKRWKIILPVVAISSLLIFMLLVLSPFMFQSVSPTESQKIYNEAKSTCGDKAWLIVHDLGVYSVPIEAPYPTDFREAASGGVVTDYNCNQNDAGQKVVFAYLSFIPFMLATLLAYLSLPLLVIWIVLLVADRISGNNKSKNL